MKPIILLALCLELVLAYHDPDLNYHLSQIQKVTDCDHGYSYNAPAVQLTTSGIKTTRPSPPVVSQSIYRIPGYQYSDHAQYSTGITYQSQPKITYASPPVASYQTSSVASNYATAQQYTNKEVHGYATSAGLSSAASNGKTPVIATYAQAPIIAKVTAAPLIAKFALSPPRTSYAPQNLAKTSLDSQNNVHKGGPIVSEVYAAPSAGYATSQALNIQQASQYAAPAQYSSAVAPTVIQYNQGQVDATIAQYTSSAVSHGSSQYFTPTVSQFARVNNAHYSTPIVAQQAAPVAPHFSSPVVSQYSSPAVVHHSAPARAQYSIPTVTHYSGAIAQYSAPSIAHYSAPAVTPVKNVHKEFLENYDAHPRYSYEYSVNDPHTGDIKQQKEERDGEVVKGQYSLVEPDGSVRTVNYVADWETGFHADVQNSKQNQH